MAELGNNALLNLVPAVNDSTLYVTALARHDSTRTSVARHLFLTMVATKECSPASAVDNIRAELNLPAPTPQTLRLLRSILGLDVSEKQDTCHAARKEAPKRTVRARNPTQTSSKPCRNAPPRIRIHESSNAKSPRLSLAERRKIATEVFNSTLKQLGQAAKTEQAASKSRIIGGTPLRPPCVERVLHQRSPNRERKKEAIPAKKPTGQSEVPDWQVVADLSQSALQYLRECETKDHANKSTTEKGLENASLILLDRTITLNLVPQAQRQLFDIHERYLGEKETRPRPSVEEVNIASLLLARPDAADQGSTFGFTTSMQSQGLRLALLLGPKAITKELLHALQLETVGSPAWTSVQGFEKGRHNSEEAGSQLRTISLAMSKLYSLGLKSTGHGVRPNDLFDLFCLALRLKFESWKRLGHSPNPELEVWRPFHVAFRKLFAATSSSQPLMASVIEHLRLFQNLLNLARQDVSIPTSLVETLIQLSQNLQSQPEILLLAEEQIRKADTVTSLIFRCHSTASRLKLLPQNQGASLSAVNHAAKAFAEMPVLSETDLQRVLLYTAYLRRAALDVMVAIEQKERGLNQDATSRGLQTALANFTYTSSSAICRQIQTTLSGSGSSLHKIRPEVLLMMLIKNVEAVLTTERCARTQTPEMEEVACAALRLCSDVIDFLLADSSGLLWTSHAKGAVGQLNVRLSNAFWARFLKLVQHRRPSSEQAAVLELSVKGVPQLEIADQKAAYLGLKYERLAGCYLEMGEQGMAKSMLQEAITFNIRDGTLSEVVELLLSGRLRLAWCKPESNCKSLARILGTHARLSLDNSHATGGQGIFYDNPSLPTLQRAVLLEKQIYAMSEKELSGDTLSLWKTEVEFVFKLLDQPECRVYRLKFANELVHLALRKSMSPLAFLPDSIQSGLVFGLGKKPDANTFIRAFEPGFCSLFALQLGFLKGSITKHALEKNVKQLFDIIAPCRTIEDAEQVLEDVERTILPLQLSVDYAHMFDQPGVALMALKTLYHVVELGLHSPDLSKASVLLQIGKIHHSLQDIASAEKAFSAGEKLLGSEESHSLLELEFALAYSEHYLNCGKLEECSSWLERAQRSWDSRDRTDGSSSSKSRLREQTALCIAAHIASTLAFHRGVLSEATTFGRQAAKIAGVIWLSIQKAWNADCSMPQMDPAGGEAESLTLGFSKLNLSSEQSPRLEVNAVMYSPLITLYCSVFSHLAVLYAHCGLYQSAAWFYEEALKVARKSGRPAVESSILSNLVLLHARAGQLEKARLGLKDLSASPPEDLTQLTRAQISINQADTQLLLGDPASAEQCYVEARQHLNDGLVRPTSTKVDQDAKKTSKAAVRPPAKRPAVKSRVRTTPATVTPTETKVLPSIPTMELRTLSESLVALQAKLQLFKSSDSNSAEVNSVSTVNDGFVNPRKAMADALRLVQTALKLFSEDAENNVLAETAMALPVRYRSARKSGRVSFVQGSAPLVRTSKPREPSRKPTQKRADITSTKDGKALIFDAYHILSAMKDCPQSRISSDIAHTIHKILAQISLLSTALGHPFRTSSLELVFDKLSPMDLALNRERLITLSERATAEASEIRSWPRLGVSHTPQVCDSVNMDMDHDLLPASWSIVSLGLNEDRSEMLVSRSNAGRSPFIVRIPLTRPDTSDVETEDLDFDSAKAVLQEIIAKANSSAHDARGCSVDKSLRRAWYDERKALDQQLATLLDNIENVWFGGFRGLLCSHDIDETALLKFGQSFSRTLNRHLPTRRKASKGADTKVELHSHVLELFVTLGHPQEAELDDAITDLLYFVIDVLQFNGERNAYDEIDFDAMMVEILEALHAYHDERSKRMKGQQSSHVILVVDKELQVFPWESISCLRGRPVSRMPSLGAVWDRLHAIRRQAARDDGYVIPATEGTYILNPSSDLTSTQDMFGEVFETQLSGFKAIVNRVPQEKEFEEALHDGSLMLYFGHGGGAQYIRGCKIRKMTKCAVTLLMGCSSAKMTECGVYEPYGTPWNYVNGGSPAVVGNLWDVTDRDIDRFAMRLMNEWGLVAANDALASASTTAAATKRAKTKTETETRSLGKRGLVSLDQAVAEARDECLLRYLNGAAPVMYGIPVFLE